MLIRQSSAINKISAFKSSYNHHHLGDKNLVGSQQQLFYVILHTYDLISDLIRKNKKILQKIIRYSIRGKLILLDILLLIIYPSVIGKTLLVVIFLTMPMNEK